jgi:hypothetical protein
MPGASSRELSDPSAERAVRQNAKDTVGAERDLPDVGENANAARGCIATGAKVIDINSARQRRRAAS